MSSEHIYYLNTFNDMVIQVKQESIQIYNNLAANNLLLALGKLDGSERLGETYISGNPLNNLAEFQDNHLPLYYKYFKGFNPKRHCISIKSNLSPYQQLYVLYHELIHIRQFNLMPSRLQSINNKINETPYNKPNMSFPDILRITETNKQIIRVKSYEEKGIHWKTELFMSYYAIKQERPSVFQILHNQLLYDQIKKFLEPYITKERKNS